MTPTAAAVRVLRRFGFVGDDAAAAIDAELLPVLEAAEAVLGTQVQHPFDICRTYYKYYECPICKLRAAINHARGE